MKSDSLWDFANNCAVAANETVVANEFLRRLADKGFVYAACCNHADPVKPPKEAVMILNYPPSWLEHFSYHAYQQFDPILLAAMRLGRPFPWNDPAVAQMAGKLGRKILREAEEYGLSGGFTIPLHAPEALPASCSLVPDSGGINPEDYAVAQCLAVYTHDTVRRIRGLPKPKSYPVLHPRERQCVLMAGRGNGDEVIADVLGISYFTVRNTLERARKRFGVASRIQLAFMTVASGDIRLEEFFD